MTDTQAKAIMSAIVWATMFPTQDENVCEFDIAAGIAEQLFDHVSVGHDGITCLDEEDDPFIAPPSNE